MNMQIAYISPPFGYNLFYLKSIAPAGVGIKDIYLAIVPFVLLQAVGLILVSLFPADIPVDTEINLRRLGRPVTGG